MFGAAGLAAVAAPRSAGEQALLGGDEARRGPADERPAPVQALGVLART
jgi:hypothetical protein